MDLLDAILPSAAGLIERKKNLKILILQDSSHNFFVLVARVNCVPIVVDALFSHQIPLKLI
jgi:hypothetical protein